MNQKIKFIILCIVSFMISHVHAQYEASPSFYTTYYDESRPFNTRPIKGTACDIAGTPDREKNYAIVGLNHHPSTYCERYAAFGIKDGAAHNIVAHSSDEFSWDHSGVTKVLFDPRNSNIFYVLYQETFRHHGTGELYDPNDRRTYLKQFYYNGSSVLTESTRLELFNYANRADFVINDNGLILVSIVDDNGYIRAKRVQDMVITGSELTFADYGEAKVGTFLQSISMDLKGNKVVLGHTTGSLSDKKMRIVRIDIINILGTPTPIIVSERFVDDHQMRVDLFTPKTVAIRENGDVFYLNWNEEYGSPSTYDLVKLEEGSTTPSYLLEDAPNLEDLVISEDDKIYVSALNGSEYRILLFDGADYLAHEYDVHADLDNPLHDLAVVDCTILASGHRFTGSHHRPSHQTFSCDECDGGNPHSDFHFENSTSGTYGPTYYGMQYIPGYCDKNDIVINGAASSCENSYWLTVQEINPATWTLIGSPVISWVGFSGEVPHDIVLADYLPALFEFDPTAKYLLTLTVGLDGGGPFHSEHKLFAVSPVYSCPSETGRLAAQSNDIQSAKVFPNPTSGILQVELQNTEESNFVYSVKNIVGATVKEGSFHDSRSTVLDMTQFAQGTYYIEITNGKTSFTEVFIKN